jgi:hypothetical protein
MLYESSASSVVKGFLLAVRKIIRSMYLDLRASA